MFNLDSCYGCCTHSSLMDSFQLYQTDSINTTDIYIDRIIHLAEAGFDITDEDTLSNVFDYIPFSSLLPEDQDRITNLIRRLTEE